MALLTVSKLGAMVGASADTLRYYERIGLLRAPERTPSGYRVYDHEAIDRLGFIKGSQRLGLRLEEIKELLAIKDGGVCPCEHTRALLERRAVQLDEELASMSRLRDDIARMLDEFPDTGPSEALCGDDLLQLGTTRRSNEAKKRGEQ